MAGDACTVYMCVPYSRKYWRGLIFGGLADLLSHCQYYCQPRRLPEKAWRSYVHVTAKFISANCNFLPFSSNPPNIIPANISVYTVYCTIYMYTKYDMTSHCRAPKRGVGVILVLKMISILGRSAPSLHVYCRTCRHMYMIKINEPQLPWLQTAIYHIHNLKHVKWHE